LKTYAIILAAGKGSRMQSELPKVLHPIGQMPMVEHLVSKLERMHIDEIIVVIGHKGHLVKQYLGSRVSYAEQTEQLGTAHAVRQAESYLKDKAGVTLVLTGDTPLIETATIRNLLNVQQEQQCAGVVLTTMQEDPTGYGRIVRDDRTGKVIGIVEEKDATPEQKQIREINAGIFCFDNHSLFRALPYIQNNNAQQEYYLTDMIEAMNKAGITNESKSFESVVLEDPVEVMGINSREQLAEAERAFNERNAAGHPSR